MQVHQAAAHLRGVELHSVSLQTRLSDFINVEPQVPAAHHGQNHTQGVFRLVGVGQIHLGGGGEPGSLYKRVEAPNSGLRSRGTREIQI